MDTISCTHLDTFTTSARNISIFSNIYSNFVKPATRQACIKKALYCLCSVCNEHSPRLHVCLSCIFFGCYDTGHIQDHAKNERHILALDVNHGHVFCFECNDYVYSVILFKLTEPLKNACDDAIDGSGLYLPWSPTWTEIELLSVHPKRRKYSDCSTIGLRGLLNLGSTCFMNVAVQVLMHTPLLRNYFLSDLHECSIGDNCAVCEVANLFQRFYSGEKGPFNPYKFLSLIWTQARHIVGYAEQDAHEFFISALDVLHRQCEGQEDQTSQCSCIIDKIFTGSLQSDISCQVCHNISTTIDPFWDISLDIGTNPNTLVDCLDRFTRPEHLEKINCSSCNKYQGSTKQLTMKKLPLVACFHLKRFEHSSDTFIRRKVDTQIEFPTELDMAPFLSHNRNTPSSDPPTQRYLYSLFAVTNHSGQLETGHYTAFVRQQKGTWFRCNDQYITRATLKDVLACEAYQLFYHKQVLDYE